MSEFLRTVLPPRLTCLALAGILVSPACAIEPVEVAHAAQETEQEVAEDIEAATEAETATEPASEADTEAAADSASSESAHAEGGEDAGDDEPQDPEDAELERMNKIISRLQTESRLRTQELEAELAALKAENQRLQQAFQLAQQKQQSELQPLQLEKARIDLEAGLTQSRRKAENAPIDAQLAALQKQQQLRSVKLAEELAEFKTQTERLQARQSLAAAERKAELADMQHEQAVLSAKNQLLSQKLLAQRLEAEAKQALAAAELNLTSVAVQSRSAQKQLQDLVEDDLVYREDPFQDGTLYITDRRIKLNGPIISGTADYVCDRIDYFNNEDPDLPIFIVIDNCPGGSVLQGYRIVESIESSAAPVHVVVKSFAASMAAVITTLADHSYAYPNAILLHHQMSALAHGNMTDLEQQVAMLQEWEARLAVPVAEKMGVTLDEFKQQMYENNAGGDWEEFADEAVRLKWVNQIVSDVREQGIRKRPGGDAPRPWFLRLLGQDENGRSYVCLLYTSPSPRDQRGSRMPSSA